MGLCSPAHPAVKFRLTYRWAEPPVVTEVRAPLARPIGLHLDAPYWPPALSPAGRFQVVGGGESGDFSLALWATLTPVAGIIHLQDGEAQPVTVAPAAVLA
jgi:hypothetical protein